MRTKPVLALRLVLISTQTFNEELDGMYQDVQLPDEEAWARMAKDLRETKKARNNLTAENSYVLALLKMTDTSCPI